MCVCKCILMSHRLNERLNAFRRRYIIHSSLLARAIVAYRKLMLQNSSKNFLLQNFILFLYKNG